MTTPCRRSPKYCRHKDKNKGYARFGSGAKPTYFPGWYGSQESLAAYHSALAEYLGGGRPAGVAPGDRLTVRQFLAAWWQEAERRYVKFGRPTNELSCQRTALRFVRQLYSDLPAADFGPVQLAAVRQKMVEAGWVRTSINLHVCRVRTVFKWAVSQGLVPVNVHVALTTLSGLRKAHTTARESVPKVPPTVWQLRAVLARCCPAVGAMIRLQYPTGMRPGEVCALRPLDLDCSREPWRYQVRPEAAKTGEEVYWIGPRAQAILAPWLAAADPHAAVFGYTGDGYRRHITRICDLAGVPRWAPHQLRHAHGTRVADDYGEEGAAKRLNHTQLRTAKQYSRTSTALARRIAREVG